MNAEFEADNSEVPEWEYYEEFDEFDDYEAGRAYLGDKIGPYLGKVGLTAHAGYTTPSPNEIGGIVRHMINTTGELDLGEELRGTLGAYMLKVYQEAHKGASATAVLLADQISRSPELFGNLFEGSHELERKASDLLFEAFREIKVKRFYQTVLPNATSETLGEDINKAIKFNIWNACLWGWHREEASNGILFPNEIL